MSEEKVKTNYFALTGMTLGIISSFLINTPLVPVLPGAALILSFAGIMEARKTQSALAYAAVGFILGLFVLIYYFYTM